MIISSLENPQVKRIIKLKKSKERKKSNSFVVEGEREIKIALKSGLEIECFCVCEEYTKNKKSNLKIDYYFEKNVFDKISKRENPDGYIAIFKGKKKSLNDLKLSENPLIFILDSIEKPGNLGAIARTADAASVDVIFLINPQVDIYNPNAIRTSQGTIFSTPILVVGREEVLTFCKEKGVKIIATSPRSEKVYTNQNFKAGSAILLGAEDKGLSEEWLELADERVKIEMRGKIDSLNLSVSTAIIAFEALRQRE